MHVTREREQSGLVYGSIAIKHHAKLLQTICTSINDSTVGSDDCRYNYLCQYLPLPSGIYHGHGQGPCMSVQVSASGLISSNSWKDRADWIQKIFNGQCVLVH